MFAAAKELVNFKTSRFFYPVWSDCLWASRWLAPDTKTSGNFSLPGETLDCCLIKTSHLLWSFTCTCWSVAGSCLHIRGKRCFCPGGVAGTLECLDHTCLSAADDPLSSSEAAFTSCGKNLHRATAVCRRSFVWFNSIQIWRFKIVSLKCLLVYFG